jgi:hypothetical protein
VGVPYIDMALPHSQDWHEVLVVWLVREDKEHSYVERRTAYADPMPTGTTTTTTRTHEAETGTAGVARVV